MCQHDSLANPLRLSVIRNEKAEPDAKPNVRKNDIITPAVSFSGVDTKLNTQVTFK
jgi:hypothetical protein